MQEDIVIRSIQEADKDWVKQVLTNLWGSSILTVKGKEYQGDTLPGFIAEQNNRRVGLVTYNIEQEKCEIITLNSLFPGKGIGSALLNAVNKAALQARCTYMNTVLTKDTMSAAQFYQKKGFVIANQENEQVYTLERKL